jgi:hypothetical protein
VYHGVCNIPVYCGAIVVENKATRCAGSEPCVGKKVRRAHAELVKRKKVPLLLEERITWRSCGNCALRGILNLKSLKGPSEQVARCSVRWRMTERRFFHDSPSHSAMLILAFRAPRRVSRGVREGGGKVPVNKERNGESLSGGCR